MNRQPPPYRVRAVNTAAESENRIHADDVAAQYGFRGGLVPGVIVYGYMTAPILEFAPDWMERGSMSLRLIEPVYHGEEVIVRAAVNGDGTMQVTAEAADGRVCANGAASNGSSATQPEILPEHPLPASRPVPTQETVRPGELLGTVVEKLDFSDPDKPPSSQILQFCNEILVRNFLFGPWIHVSSEIANWSAVRHGDAVSARGRIHDRFDRKGHEFVVADVVLVADGNRLVQSVRHTAIYRPRQASNKATAPRA